MHYSLYRVILDNAVISETEKKSEVGGTGMSCCMEHHELRPGLSVRDLVLHVSEQLVPRASS
jgi:hypothetical protein